MGVESIKCWALLVTGALISYAPSSSLDLLKPPRHTAKSGTMKWCLVLKRRKLNLFKSMRLSSWMGCTVWARLVVSRNCLFGVYGTIQPGCWRMVWNRTPWKGDMPFLPDNKRGSLYGTMMSYTLRDGIVERFTFLTDDRNRYILSWCGILHST